MKEGKKSLFLLGPFSTILGWSRRLQSDHQLHTDGPSTLVKKPSPALTFLAQAEREMAKETLNNAPSFKCK